MTTIGRWVSSAVATAAIAFAGAGVTAGAAQTASTPEKPAAAQAQTQTPPAPQPGQQRVGQRRSPRLDVPMDPERARRLYVPTDPKFQSIGTDYQRDMQRREADEARYPDLCKGIIDYKKITYRSSVGGLEIPAYLFQPLEKRRAARATRPWSGCTAASTATGHEMYLPVRQGGGGARLRGHRARVPRQHRLRRGLPRGHRLRRLRGRRRDLGLRLPEGQRCRTWTRTRIGIMGWSHGGYITALSVFREQHPFQARRRRSSPSPTSIFRLSYKGPGYQRDFATQKRHPGGLPFEKPDEYIERSPLYHVDRLAGAPAGARRHQRHRRGLRGGPAARRRAAGAQAGPCGDQGLRGPGAGARTAAATPSAAGWTRDAGARRIRPRSATRGTAPGCSSSGSAPLRGPLEASRNSAVAVSSSGSGLEC